MSFTNVVDIILIVLCVLGYAIQMYFKVKGNVIAAVSELVATAEKTGLTGSEKMAQVVACLYEQVPAPMKKILTEDRLRKMAQSIFNWMRRYAEAYVEATEKSETQEEREEAVKDAVSQLNVEAASELIAGLYGLGLDALRAKAEEYGITVDPKAQKRDIAQAIIVAVLNKA